MACRTRKLPAGPSGEQASVHGFGAETHDVGCTCFARRLRCGIPRTHALSGGGWCGASSRGG
eukprot:3593708-Rhodomonas_salina.1